MQQHTGLYLLVYSVSGGGGGGVGRSSQQSTKPLPPTATPGRNTRRLDNTPACAPALPGVLRAIGVARG